MRRAIIINDNDNVAVDEKTPAKLVNLKEEPVVIDFDYQLDKNYNTKNLYEKALSKISIVKNKVITNTNSKEF